MTETRYYPNCPTCGDVVSLFDDVLPWGHIPDDPRPCIAHTRCRTIIPTVLVTPFAHLVSSWTESSAS